MNPLSLKDLLRASAPSGRAGFVSFWAFSPYLIETNPHLIRTTRKVPDVLSVQEEKS